MTTTVFRRIRSSPYVENSGQSWMRKSGRRERGERLNNEKGKKRRTWEKTKERRRGRRNQSSRTQLLWRMERCVTDWWRRDRPSVSHRERACGIYGQEWPSRWNLLRRDRSTSLPRKSNGCVLLRSK